MQIQVQIEFQTAMTRFLYISFVLVIIFQSCVLSKESFDKRNLKKIEKHKSTIPELVDFSVSLLGHKQWLEIDTDTLSDKTIKRKIKNLGKISSIYVRAIDTFAYERNEPNDSIVTFNRVSFFYGVEHIIYDYSKQNKSFPSYVSSSGDYKFISIGNRIYYRRRPFPWM